MAGGLYIHRLAPSESNVILNQCPAYGKIPLLRTPNDGIDESLFPPEKYHYMQMTSSNTIRPNGEHPQAHIIVKSNAPKASAIAKMYRQGPQSPPWYPQAFSFWHPVQLADAKQYRKLAWVNRKLFINKTGISNFVPVLFHRTLSHQTSRDTLPNSQDKFEQPVLRKSP